MSIRSSSSSSLRVLYCLSLAISLLSFVMVGSARDGVGETRQSGRPRADSSQCKDENGMAFSQGALRKVNDQVQRCDLGNRWVLAPGFGAPINRTGAPKKECLGKHGERYDSGLYRAATKGFENCENGRWLSVK